MLVERQNIDSKNNKQSIDSKNKKPLCSNCVFPINSKENPERSQPKIGPWISSLGIPGNSLAFNHGSVSSVFLGACRNL
jgi:hypothetical protein